MRGLEGEPVTTTTHQVSTATRSGPDRMTLAGLGVVAVAAAVTSFDALDGLAGAAGWSREVRPALPLIVDVLAAVSTRAWLSGSAPGEARRFAKRAALFSIMLSMAGNVAFHLLAAGWLRPSVGLVIGVAMVPPVGLAASAHLVAVLRSAAPAPVMETAAETAADPAPVSALVSGPASEPAPVVVATVPDMTTDTNPAPKPPARRADTAAKVAKLRQRHPDASAAELARRLGVSDRTVRRHLAALAAA